MHGVPFGQCAQPGDVKLRLNTTTTACCQQGDPYIKEIAVYITMKRKELWTGKRAPHSFSSSTDFDLQVITILQLSQIGEGLRRNTISSSSLWRKTTVKKKIIVEETVQKFNFFNISAEEQGITKTNTPTSLPIDAPSKFNDDFYVNLAFDFPHGDGSGTAAEEAIFGGQSRKRHDGGRDDFWRRKRRRCGEKLGQGGALRGAVKMILETSNVAFSGRERGGEEERRRKHRARRRDADVAGISKLRGMRAPSLGAFICRHDNKPSD
ncbi:hypothetical protein KSP40_PGU020606 [Platanthera guangdongensis]|uniref:Uncharacterized protein n=1 Tax=Platanthera guangdongensis TaxID=2320717 RepID=A0ABR2M6X4_9ASPA